MQGEVDCLCIGVRGAPLVDLLAVGSSGGGAECSTGQLAIAAVTCCNGGGMCGHVGMMAYTFCCCNQLHCITHDWAGLQLIIGQSFCRAASTEVPRLMRHELASCLYPPCTFKRGA